MQINHYPDSLKKSLEWLLKSGFTIACFYFIFTHADWQAVDFTALSPEIKTLAILGAVLFLMPVNWVLEAERWRRSIPAEGLSFQEAMSIILAGNALNWVVPLTLGDAGGRLSMVRNYQKSIKALLVNRVIMSCITMVFGGLAVLFYFQMELWYVLPVLLIGLVVVGFYLGRKTSEHHWALVSLLSVIRYGVFTLQFFLVLHLCLPGVDGVLLLLGVGWIYLFRTFVPSLFGNFGVREASALLFFEHYLPDVSIVILPCLIIWFINSVIPALLGSLSIFQLKLNIAQ